METLLGGRRCCSGAEAEEAAAEAARAKAEAAKATAEATEAVEALAKARVQAAHLAGELDATDSRSSALAKEGETAVRKLRYQLHLEGREGLAAAQLCRQSIKEIAATQAALDATLATMERERRRPGAPAVPSTGAPAPELVAGGGGGGARVVVPRASALAEEAAAGPPSPRRGQYRRDSPRQCLLERWLPHQPQVWRLALL